MGTLLKSGAVGVLRQNQRTKGVVWRAAERAQTALAEEIERQPAIPVIAFAGVYLFTVVLYTRPQELFPLFFEEYPIQLARTIAIATPLIYIYEQLYAGRPLIRWTNELKATVALAALGILFLPVTANTDDTKQVLTEVYSKVVVIFALMISLIDTRRRLYAMMRMMVFCGVYIAYDTFHLFFSGRVEKKSARVVGSLGGMFENPNDLATSFVIWLPLAVTLGLLSRGLRRWCWFALAAFFGAATVVTFSRGGFLALIAVAGLIVWKLRHQSKALPWVAGIIMAGVLLLALPGGFGDRLFTILRPSGDKTGSAQERIAVLKRGVILFVRRPLTGVGMGNFHAYSVNERLAHNSYLEVAAELGILGLLAYLVLVFAPLKALLQVERETIESRDGPARERYYLSVGLQAALLAYYVSSFFASLQYVWPGYYPIALAVALRFIHARERTGDFTLPDESLIRPLRSVLWRTRAATDGRFTERPEPVSGVLFKRGNQA